MKLFHDSLLSIIIIVGRITIWLLKITLKIDQCGVMLNAIKDLSMLSSSPIDFEVEWYSSWSNKWYQSQSHGFESRKCHCEGGIIGGTTIWLPITTLKTSLRGVMSNAIKDLSVLFLSPIGFEVEWHSSRSIKWYQSHDHMFESWECHCERGIVGGDHNLTPYNHSKYGPAWCDVKCHKRFECAFLITNWF